jgi:hypothetical protein
VLQKIEYARRQAVDAYARAAEAADSEGRAEWLKAASMWEQLIGQYERLLKILETGQH